MQTFTYPFLFKWIFRYGNIPLTILLLFYLVPAAVNIDRDLLYIIPFVITLTLIYLLNRHYLLLYKILPYKIEIDKEKMVCSNFIFSEKEVVIRFENIEKISGGIFDRRLTGVMKVCDGHSKICIGFYSRIKNIQELQTIILSRVPRKVYDEVIDRVGFKKDNEKNK